MPQAFDWNQVQWPAASIGAVVMFAGLGLRRLTNGQVRHPAAALGLGLAGAALLLWAAMQGWKDSGPPPPPFRMAECLAILPPPAPSASAPVPVLAKDSVGLLGGQGAGTYAQLARDIAAAAARRGVHVVPLESKGTFENLERMLSKANAAFGFGQSDLRAGVRPADQATKKIDTLRLVLPLYPEELHVLARAPLKRWSDLAGKRIVTSKTSEGSGHTAKNLLQHTGVQAASMETTASANEALCSVLADDGDADAMVAVGGKPLPLFTELEKLQAHKARPLERVSFLEVPQPDSTHADLRTYEKGTVLAADYPWLPTGTAVNTLAVRALLIAYDFSSHTDRAFFAQRCRQLRVIAEALRAELPRLQQPPNHPAWRRVDLSHPVTDWRWDTCANPGGKPPN